MPYKVEQRGENYIVVNEESGREVATHEPPDAKEKAERQVRLLESIEERGAQDHG